MPLSVSWGIILLFYAVGVLITTYEWVVNDFRFSPFAIVFILLGIILTVIMLAFPPKKDSKAQPLAGVQALTRGPKSGP